MAAQRSDLHDWSAITVPLALAGMLAWGAWNEATRQPFDFPFGLPREPVVRERIALGADPAGTPRGAVSVRAGRGLVDHRRQNGLHESA